MHHAPSKFVSRISLVATLLSIAFAGSGCGLLIDTAWLIDKDHTTTKKNRYSTPLPMTEERVVARVAIITDPAQLRESESLAGATQRLSDRKIVCDISDGHYERMGLQTSTYKYRGGYPALHTIAAITEGVTAGFSLALLQANCRNPDNDLDCDLSWWAAPFLLDAAYSTVRALMVKKPLLRNSSKDRNEATVFVPNALRAESTATDCPADLTFHISFGNVSFAQQFSLGANHFVPLQAFESIRGALMTERENVVIFARRADGSVQKFSDPEIEQLLSMPPRPYIPPTTQEVPQEPPPMYPPQQPTTSPSQSRSPSRLPSDLQFPSR